VDTNHLPRQSRRREIVSQPESTFCPCKFIRDREGGKDCQAEGLRQKRNHRVVGYLCVFLFCLGLSYLVLPCLVLSYFALPCLVLSRLVLSCLVLERRGIQWTERTKQASWPFKTETIAYTEIYQVDIPPPPPHSLVWRQGLVCPQDKGEQKTKRNLTLSLILVPYYTSYRWSRQLRE
jgi:hypothetical protein